MAKPKARKALQKQRLKKRSTTLPVKWTLIAVGLLGSVILAVVVFKAISSRLATGPEAAVPANWQLQVSGLQLKADQLHDLHRAVNSAVPVGSPSELSFAARLLQTELEVERVQLVRTSYSGLNLYITPRKAFMRIHTGQERLLTESGQIYGKAEAGHDDLTLIKGIPIDNARWRSDGTLTLASQSQALVMQAIALTKAARKRGFDAAVLSYIPYRGFALTRAKDRVEVIVGFPPYPRKLDRLAQLLEGLKKNSSHVERIELDYQGKAFIKEKKS